MKLNAKARMALPTSDFAIPSKGKKNHGSYPVNDPNHARAALSMVSRYGDSEEKAAVRRKVRAKYPNMGTK